MELAREDQMELATEGIRTESGRVEPGVVEPSLVDQAVLSQLLMMANVYRSEGNLWQATELYWKLAKDYPGTPQANTARGVLLELATASERAGNRHLARSMYERLLRQEA